MLLENRESLHFSDRVLLIYTRTLPTLRLEEPEEDVKPDVPTEDDNQDVPIKDEPIHLAVPKGGARKQAVSRVPRPEEIIQVESDEEPEPPDVAAKYELLAAVESLSYHTLHLRKTKRLPFLVRNLRKGFLGRCIQNKIKTRAKLEPNLQIAVIYRLLNSGSDGYLAEYHARIEEWLCPLCELHGRFPTREMLQKHLWQDHPEVDVVWRQEPVRDIDKTKLESLK